MAYGGRALKTAMKAAAGSGARVALVLGDRELEAGTVEVKNLASGEQTTVPLGDVLAARPGGARRRPAVTRCPADGRTSLAVTCRRGRLGRRSTVSAGAGTATGRSRRGR